MYEYVHVNYVCIYEKCNDTRKMEKLTYSINTRVWNKSINIWLGCLTNEYMFHLEFGQIYSVINDDTFNSSALNYLAKQQLPKCACNAFHYLKHSIVLLQRGHFIRDSLQWFFLFMLLPTNFNWMNEWMNNKYHVLSMFGVLNEAFMLCTMYVIWR